MKVSGILLFVLILGGFSGPRCAAAVYNSDGTAASVQSIHNNQAHDGDTITVPSGRFSWTNGIYLTKAITLQGNTTTNTVTGQCVDNTIILDNISRDLNKPLIELNGNAGQRISGLTFQAGLTSTAYNGLIRVEAGTTPARIDHCHFHGCYWSPQIGVFSQNWGVFDHNVMDNNVVGNGGFVHFWPGANTDKGDSMFETSAGFGGPNFLFLEDNWLDGGTDITAGGKICARYNKFFGNNSLGSHGTARTFPDARGGRAYEVYNNEFNYTNNSSSLDGIDGGSCIYHHNVVIPHTYGISIQVYRLVQSYGPPFGLADGNNPWDLNDQQTHTVLRVLDQPGLGAGAHINRNSPAWPNQANEPCYSWNNHNQDDGSSFNITLGQGSRTILAGRDFFNNTPMPGYTPYTYPHPLAVDGNPSPPPRPPPAPTATPGERPAEMDFNNDGFPDYLLYNPSTRQTVIWYLNNNVLTGRAYGPTPWPGWSLVGVADFNGDGKPDYLLYNPSTRKTVIWYLHNNVKFGHAYGPTPWPGWNLVGAADFNGDGKPDYLLYNPSTRQTVIWYLHNNVKFGHAYGPTPWPGWNLVGAADFNGDGKPDYLLYNPSTRQTVMWYLNNNALIGHAYGPTPWQGWSLVGAADFNGDGKSDYLFYNPSTRQTVIWYLNRFVLIGHAYGPTPWQGWSLVAP
jgi:FG-GAP-like repeat